MGALALASLSGCVIAVPTALPEKKPFADAAKEHLKSGVTTPADVKTLFGPPDWKSANVWVYRRPRLGWAWFICSVPEPTGGCQWTPRKSTDYLLSVSFDDASVLADYSVGTQRDICEHHKVCVGGDLLSVAAPEALDAKSKEFSVSPDSCEVYLLPENSLTGWRVYLDGGDVGGVVSGDSYLHLSVPRLNHHVYFYNTVLREATSGIRIDCRSKQLQYIGLKSRERSVLAPKLLDESEGRREVQQRWLADPKPAYTVVEDDVLRDGEIVAFHEGDAVTLYGLDKAAGVSSFGTSASGEICGLQSALVDYRLLPAGGTDSLYLVDRKGNSVQLAAVCNAEGGCELPSLFGHGTCRIEPTDSIAFVLPDRNETQDLLVIEPAGGRKGFRELYFGSVAKIAERATCKGRTCELQLVALRH